MMNECVEFVELYNSLNPDSRAEFITSLKKITPPPPLIDRTEPHPFPTTDPA